MNVTRIFPNTYGLKLRGKHREKSGHKSVTKSALRGKTTAKTTASQAALIVWRREVRSGIKGQKESDSKTWNLDALWKAAALEAAASDCENSGMGQTAGRLRREAAILLVTAGREGRLV